MVSGRGRSRRRGIRGGPCLEGLAVVGEFCRGCGRSVAAIIYRIFMRTLQSRINANPGINVLAFERNASKSYGFGEGEEVCGFCLASHYFDEEPPEFCKFCRAPLRKTHAISDLPSIRDRVYEYRFNSSPIVKSDGSKLRIVTVDKTGG